MKPQLPKIRKIDDNVLLFLKLAGLSSLFWSKLQSILPLGACFPKFPISCGSGYVRLLVPFC